MGPAHRVHSKAFVACRKSSVRSCLRDLSFAGGASSDLHLSGSHRWAVRAAAPPLGQLPRRCAWEPCYVVCEAAGACVCAFAPATHSRWYMLVDPAQRPAVSCVFVCVQASPCKLFAPCFWLSTRAQATTLPSWSPPT